MIKRKNFPSKGKTNDISEDAKEEKFSLISCHLGNDYCNDTLKELNRLYEESETARINNEYLKSIEVLGEAYEKTKDLNRSTCVRCADLLRYSIVQTLNLMKKEIEELTKGFFGKKNYQTAYLRLCDLEKKITEK